VKRAAVIVNPTKCTDAAGLHEQVTSAMRSAGWQPPLWFETTEQDPGSGVTRQALDEGADLVVACGGDGTVTACTAALAGTGVPLAILPLGTGNLLARNLDMPLDLEKALDLAMTGGDRALDVGTADGEPFVVMAGMGFDAVMLADAGESLKAAVGWPAYVLSALRHLRDQAVRVELRADDAPPSRRRIHGLVVGNVGRLQGSVPLLPDAEPDDGLLDVVLLAPTGLTGWARLAFAVVLRRPHSAQLERLHVRTLDVVASRAMPCERDGELADTCRELHIGIMPGALLVRCVPSQRSAEAQDSPSQSSLTGSSA
jgi:YegS/Rv2252/BmrU family lipid kinase